ncbi:alpha/beta hydrolase [Calothrix rhizosoleniae]|uniref:alpha/beta hydrolase n=1 Tax=Calothrix rhizosoleniae TaxID=888997 RepID=UPI000B4A2213|nr:alpha/beta hydrolase [Calothrix rhizosoleniae]
MKSLFGNGNSVLKKYSLPFLLSMLIPTLGMSESARSAERIYASYSALELSIPVTAMEKFAQTGKIEQELAVYRQYLKPEQIKELHRVLTSPVKLHPVAVSQFLYTQQGELLLRRLGDVIKTRSRQPKPGFYALRSALILASQEPGGLTLLNVLRKYPTGSIHIDLARTLGIASELEKMVRETNRAIATVSQKSEIEAANIPFSQNNFQLQNLRRPGKFKWQKIKSRKLLDFSRKRLVLTDVYLPQSKTKASVIVISHGLGSDSSNFRYLASHLASHGFAVVVPNHPGSNSKKLQLLLDGRTGEIIQSNEFYDRPLDIKFVLDRLESDPSLKNRLNLQQVGVFGQSLGGYTALALAGAKLDYNRIQKDCNSQAVNNTWNLSVLLQCGALKVERKNREKDLRDSRVKAVIAVNPITSTVFCESGLSQVQIPVMVVASSDDTVAPALYEQIQPFSWIPTSQKYLALLSGGTHFSTIGNGSSTSEAVELPSQLIGDNPKQARSYMKSLSMPFFGTYVVGSSQYKQYLNAAYAKVLSRQSIGLSLIQSLTPNDLAQYKTVGSRE